MKALTGIFVLLAAMLFAGCPAPADTNENASNTENAANADADGPAEDLAAVLSGIETKAHEAWKAKDGAYFEEMLSDKFVASGAYVDKAGLVKRIKESTCDVKDFKLEDVKVEKLSDSAALLTYKNILDATCDGKQRTSPNWVAAAFVKEGDAWKMAFRDAVAAADAKGETLRDPKPEGMKNAEDELTKALSETETKWWEDWKKKQNAHFEANSSDAFVTIGPSGRFNKAESLKRSQETPCDVGNFNLEGFKATEISPGVAVLTYFGTVDAKCGDEKLPNMLFSNSIYVKEGDSWKIAFYAEDAAA